MMIDIDKSCQTISKYVNYYNYLYGKTLTDVVIRHKPNRILEFGTGTGYTALNLALGCYVNNFGSVITHDVFETQSVGIFKVHEQNTFKSNVSMFPELSGIIQSNILDYMVWLKSEKCNEFDLIYFDVNNDGDKILDIFNALNIPSNKGKILLFEGGHVNRPDGKYKNVRPIHDNLVKSVTGYTLLYNQSPGIIQIEL